MVKVLSRRRVPGTRVLEVACGTGSHTKILVERVYRVDLSDDVLRIAQEGQERRTRGMKRKDSNVKGMSSARFEFSSHAVEFSPCRRRSSAPR